MALVRREMWRSAMAHPPNSPAHEPAFRDPGPHRDELSPRAVRVAIPPEVKQECCSTKVSLDALMIRTALNESRIGVVPVRDKRLVAKVQGDFGLGKGEAEAIVLALAQKAAI